MWTIYVDFYPLVSSQNEGFSLFIVTESRDLISQSKSSFKDWGNSPLIFLDW